MTALVVATHMLASPDHHFILSQHKALINVVSPSLYITIGMDVSAKQYCFVFSPDLEGSAKGHSYGIAEGT